MKRKRGGDVVLPPGRIVQPIAGTERYDRKGRALGIWGKDFPSGFFLLLDNGELRDLTDAEARLAERLYGLSSWLSVMPK